MLSTTPSTQSYWDWVHSILVYEASAWHVIIVAIAFTSFVIAFTWKRSRLCGLDFSRCLLNHGHWIIVHMNTSAVIYLTIVTVSDLFLKLNVSNLKRYWIKWFYYRFLHYVSKLDVQTGQRMVIVLFNTNYASINLIKEPHFEYQSNLTAVFT